LYGIDYNEVLYDYDHAGRLDSIDWTASGQGSGTTYSYEDSRNLKIRVKNAYNARLISQYDYEYDELGQRSWMKPGGKAYMQALNDKLRNAPWFESAGSEFEMPSEYRDYKYDNIGNRDTATTGNSEDPGAFTTSYTPDSLNQYDSTATDTSINTILGYDDDGNLLTNSTTGIKYAYDAENRLISVQPQSLITGDTKVEFLYDFMGRRSQKDIYTYQSSTWNLESRTLFVYDGWNLIQELDLDVSDGITTTVQKSYVWGLDLSQSLQGAGGVGGLLAVVDSSSTIGYFCYDGNGNVGQIIDGSDGTILAHYEYDPFGQLVYSSGDMSDDNGKWSSLFLSLALIYGKWSSLFLSLALIYDSLFLCLDH